MINATNACWVGCEDLSHYGNCETDGNDDVNSNILNAMIVDFSSTNYVEKVRQVCSDFQFCQFLVVAIIDPGLHLETFSSAWKRSIHDVLPKHVEIVFCRVVWHQQGDVGFYCPQGDDRQKVYEVVAELTSRRGKKIVELENDLECDIYHALLLLYSIEPQIATAITVEQLSCIQLPDIDVVHTSKLLETLADSPPEGEQMDLESSSIVKYIIDFIEWRKAAESQDSVPDGKYITNNMYQQALEVVMQLQYSKTNKLITTTTLFTQANESNCGNLLQGIPTLASKEEIFTSIIPRMLKDCTVSNIEQIVSTGQCSQSWYDQEEHEFVIVLQGTAALQYESGGPLHIMEKGNWAYLQPHCKHRVFWTSADTTTVWMAIFFRSVL